MMIMLAVVNIMLVTYVQGSLLTSEVSTSYVSIGDDCIDSAKRMAMLMPDVLAAQSIAC